MDEKNLFKKKIFHFQRGVIPISVLKNLIFIIIFSFALFLPKIYVASQIYLTSVKINKKLNEYFSLKAEHSILLSKIKQIKFKNRLNIIPF